MTDIRTIIAELRELEAKATPTPWVKSTVHPCIMEQRTTLDTMCMRDSGKNADANADFVLASRNALPILLDYIAKLEAVADAAKCCASGVDLAYDAVSKGLYDEALLHLGHHGARIRRALDS